MTRVARLLHLDDGEFPALRAQIEAEPMPRVGVPATTRPPLPLGAPPRSIAALAGLRAEAPVPSTRRRPAPKPAVPFGPNRYAALEYTAFVSMRIVGDAYDAIADELESALAELAELAPFAAKAGC